MKRLFTLLATLIMVVMVSLAQQNLHIWNYYGGKSTVLPASQVDSLTFSGDTCAWLFHLPTPESSEVTANSFTISAKASFYENVKSIVNETPEVGICYSYENNVPTLPSYTDTGHNSLRVLGKEIQEHSLTLYNLIPGTTYYYRTYVRFLGVTYYSEVNSVTTLGEKPNNPQDVIINGHEFVDLGLPSGLLWARTNVDYTKSLNRRGFFAWGETEIKSAYSWSNYKWGDGSESEEYGELTKYNSTDGKTTLDPEDDCATVQWGEGCRMPSSSEFLELCRNCNWSLTFDQGRTALLLVGTNGNSITFPAKGYRNDNRLYYSYYGYYWTRSLDEEYPFFARCLFFKDDGVPTHSSESRTVGMQVRAVAEK